MSKDVFRTFKKTSKALIEAINKNDFLTAENILRNAKEEYNFSETELLRFQIDHAQPDLFLKFATEIHCTEDETNQYSLYFQARNLLNLTQMPKMLKKYNLISILKIINEDIMAHCDSKYFCEMYIDFLNYVLYNHSNSYQSLIFKMSSNKSLYNTCSNEFLEYNYHKNCLNSFRLGFCNIILEDNIFSYEETNTKQIEIANIEANLSNQMYYLFTPSLDNPNSFFENANNIIQLIEKNRKWYGLDRYDFKKVSFYDLVNAYLVLFYEAYKCYIKGNANMLISKTKRQWIKTLHSYNVFKGNEDAFLEIMTFTYTKNRLVDIRDTPLIYFKRKFHLIPSIALTNDISNIVAYRIKEKSSISQKGFDFEEEVRDNWSKLHTVTKSDETENGEQYECDMAFVFDNCLFICELKNEIQPSSPEDWFKFNLKQQQHLNQLERITNHFKKSQKLKETLGKDKDWIPTEVISLLLYGCKYGKPIKMQNTFIANEKDVYNFFNKTPCYKHIFNNDKEMISIQEYLPGYEYLSRIAHILTISDFHKYMECPMALKYIMTHNIIDN